MERRCIIEKSDTGVSLTSNVPEGTTDPAFTGNKRATGELRETRRPSAPTGRSRALFMLPPVH